MEQDVLYAFRKLEARLNRLLEACPHEVDDYYLTESTTPPATRWPGTTWAALGGHFLVGWAGSGTFNVDIGTQGGAETHEHSIPDHPYVDNTSGGAYRTIPGPGHTGGTDNASSLPPYRVCYIWRRTA